MLARNMHACERISLSLSLSTCTALIIYEDGFFLWIYLNCIYTTITSIFIDRIGITSSLSFFLVVWLHHQFTILFIKIVLINIMNEMTSFYRTQSYYVVLLPFQAYILLQVVGMQLFHTNGSMFSISIACKTKHVYTTDIPRIPFCVVCVCICVRRQNLNV